MGGLRKMLTHEREIATREEVGIRKVEETTKAKAVEGGIIALATTTTKISPFWFTRNLLRIF